MNWFLFLILRNQEGQMLKMKESLSEPHFRAILYKLTATIYNIVQRRYVLRSSPGQAPGD
jgi:hypothetical protein